MDGHVIRSIGRYGLAAFNIPHVSFVSSFCFSWFFFFFFSFGSVHEDSLLNAVERG